MSEKEWARFFELVTKIVDQPKPVSEKAKEVNERAMREGAAVSWEELLGWFPAD